MRLSIIFLFFILSIIFIANASAQQTIAALDTSYAHGGKVEIALSNFSDEFMDFYAVFPDIQNTSTVTICGKVGTADSTLKRIGLIQLHADGTFDSTFGNDGKIIASWGVSDYPNAMIVNSVDSSIMIAGASGLSPSDVDQIPALYKFKKNGVPDSGFGSDGHVAIRYDLVSSGEFTNIFTQFTNVIACGEINSSLNNGHNGFCAMRFLPNGQLDTTFGIAGKALISESIHSVHGFLTKNASITFIGVSNKIDSDQSPMVVLARMTSFGLPDSTFGRNGFVNTGIMLPLQSDIIATIQPDYKIVASLPPTSISSSVPFTVVRFTTNGTPDSAYGANGIVRIPFGPDAAEAKGMSIAKNGKAVVNGIHDNGCATTRINIDGTPDITFNKTGNATIDVDSGAFPNYLKRFEGIGNKRYLGFGSSVHNGKMQFLIARFKDDSLHSSVKITLSQNNPLSIYPNPVSSDFKISVGDGLKNISIVDALGREVMMLDEQYYFSDLKIFSLDGRALPNGIYHCVAQNEVGRVVQKFVVAH